MAEKEEFEDEDQVCDEEDDPEAANMAIIDSHESFFFGISGSIFLNNFHRGQPANLLSGSVDAGGHVDLDGISGSNCMYVTLTSGSPSTASSYFKRVLTASQHKVGNNFVTGVYSASFTITEYLTATLREHLKGQDSAVFVETWGSLDGTV